MSKKYDFCVFIGRMQPPHKDHIRNIRTALSLADKAIVIFGSHRAARNIKNPFTVEEREAMVRSCFNKEEQDNIIFSCVRDYYYNDNIWVTNIQQQVAEIAGDKHRICLLGRYKDHTSYYLNLFPQWKREEVNGHDENLNATDVRNIFFDTTEMSRNEKMSVQLEKPVHDYLSWWSAYGQVPIYNKLAEEWLFIRGYKEMWAQAPYPVTFMTTDAVVVKSGHVLMVRRKFNPGKGLLALPGGFVKQHLTTLNSALEELKEETRIKMPREDIKNYLRDDHEFDHPNRSLRGRTITHAYYFELPAGGDMPQVKGDDDAERAMWIPITELFARESEIYEDHLHIVNYFYSKPRPR